MFGPLGGWELVIVLLVVAVLFGHRKLPDIGRGLGKAITNFKKSVKDPEPIAESSSDSEESKKDKKSEE